MNEISMIPTFGHEFNERVSVPGKWSFVSHRTPREETYVMCDASRVSHEKAEMCVCRRGAFLPNFQESLFLSQIHIIGTSLVPKG